MLLSLCCGLGTSVSPGLLEECPIVCSCWCSCPTVHTWNRGSAIWVSATLGLGLVQVEECPKSCLLGGLGQYCWECVRCSDSPLMVCPALWMSGKLVPSLRLVEEGLWSEPFSERGQYFLWCCHPPQSGQVCLSSPPGCFSRVWKSMVRTVSLTVLEEKLYSEPYLEKKQHFQ